MNLQNKRCLITGADHGIGAALVQAFAQRGAQVIAGFLKLPDKIDSHPNILSVAMDVTSSQQIRGAVERGIDHFGAIDVLVNNAGVFPRRAASEMGYDDWRKVVEINLDGAWRCCEAVIPIFLKKRSGIIINVSSITLEIGMPHLVHYLSAKGGVEGMTRGLARDLGPHGVRVNCVRLGAVLVDSERVSDPDLEETNRMVNSKQCLQGRMTPETVEPVFTFLASESSSDITGQTITVDRGWTHD